MDAIFCLFLKSFHRKQVSEMVSAQSSLPSSMSPNPSGAPMKGVPKRDGRGISKRPESQMTIMEVTLVGVPLHPKKAAASFWTIYGILGRERVPITTISWKFLMDVERDQLWVEISSSFEICQTPRRGIPVDLMCILC